MVYVYNIKYYLQNGPSHQLLQDKLPLLLSSNFLKMLKFFLPAVLVAVSLIHHSAYAADSYYGYSLSPLEQYNLDEEFRQRQRSWDAQRERSQMRLNNIEAERLQNQQMQQNFINQQNALIMQGLPSIMQENNQRNALIDRYYSMPPNERKEWLNSLPSYKRNEFYQIEFFNVPEQEKESFFNSQNDEFKNSITKYYNNRIAGYNNCVNNPGDIRYATLGGSSIEQLCANSNLVGIPKFLINKLLKNESLLDTQHKNKKIDTAKTSIQTSKKRPDIPFYRAVNKYDAGKYDDAAREFSLFIERCTDYEINRVSFVMIPQSCRGGSTLEARYYLAECYFQRSDFAQAVLEYDRVVTKHPMSSYAPIAYLKRGICFSKLAQNAAAKANMKQLIDKYPESPEAVQAKNFLKTNF